MMFYDPEFMIETIKQYAEEHKSFDTEFIVSIESNFNEYGELTSYQLQAMENIINKFRMIKK